MRSPRHAKARPDDLARLQQAHRLLIQLSTGLSPGQPDYKALERATDAVRTCAIDWTGDPNVWVTGHAARAFPVEAREGMHESEGPMGRLDGSRLVHGRSAPTK